MQQIKSIGRSISYSMAMYSSEPKKVSLKKSCNPVTNSPRIVEMVEKKPERQLSTFSFGPDINAKSQMEEVQRYGLLVSFKKSNPGIPNGGTGGTTKNYQNDKE